MGIQQHQKRVPVGGLAFRGSAFAALLIAMHGVARADCIDDAAAFEHVSVGLMRAIAQVESGTRTNVINTNSNGTTDIGLMQINSSWLPRLAREGITEQSLLDPCTNAYVGAWILSQNIRQYGPTWNAVGAYNASSPDKRLAYAQKVYDTAQSISSTQDASMPILPPSFTPPQTYNPFASLNVQQVKVAPQGAAAAAAAAHRPGSPGGPATAVIAASAPGAYNFGWAVTGADDAKPVQVFDDGAKIYVQFADMKRIPAIFADTPRGRVVLRWEAQPPYAVIASLESKLVFQIGPAEAIAQRSAAGDATKPGKPGTPPLQAGAPAAPTATTAAAATAVAGKSPAAVDPAAARKASTSALWYLSVPSTAPATRAVADTTPGPAAPATPAAPAIEAANTASTAPSKAAPAAAPLPRRPTPPPRARQPPTRCST
ncbi:transglycosylase SLT domain-containing protein [Burkholderia sp. 22PA0099]|uniref:lytic transglycosylase domain-containing protein n=1 Tax=Burkholderia sp. 22PA0099 TaxID=3237372 RepID=UPI0039C0D2A2